MMKLLSIHKSLSPTALFFTHALPAEQSTLPAYSIAEQPAAHKGIENDVLSYLGWCSPNKMPQPLA